MLANYVESQIIGVFGVYNVSLVGGGGLLRELHSSRKCGVTKDRVLFEGANYNV